MNEVGSSPLTRGKRDELIQVAALAGLIPAHAGKTRRVWTVSVNRRAHPRSRGENADSEVRVRERAGSSPLTRGKPAKKVKKCAPAGLIPAHAGKTRAGRVYGRADRAHPRSRGENTIPGCFSLV